LYGLYNTSQYKRRAYRTFEVEDPASQPPIHAQGAMTTIAAICDQMHRTGARPGNRRAEGDQDRDDEGVRRGTAARDAPGEPSGNQRGQRPRRRCQF
jgi:hypothetical protein